MHASHVKSLLDKCEKLEREIREESSHAARDDMRIERLKKERLRLKEEIERTEKRARG